MKLVQGFLGAAAILLACPLAAAQLDLDPAYEIETATTLPSPTGLAWGPEGELWVSHQVSSTAGPHAGGSLNTGDLATAPGPADGQRSGRWVRLPMVEGRALASMPGTSHDRLGQSQQYLATTPQGQLLSIGSEDDTVYRWEPGTGPHSAVASLPTQSMGRGMVVSTDGHLLVAAAHLTGGALWRFDLTTERSQAAELLNVLLPGQEPLALAVGPRGEIFVALRQWLSGEQSITRVLFDDAGEVAAIDAPYASLPVFGEARVQSLAVDSEGRLVVAIADPSSGRAELLRIDGDGFGQRLLGGLSMPTALVFDADDRLFVADRGQQVVYRLMARQDGLPPAGDPASPPADPAELVDPAGATQLCTTQDFSTPLDPSWLATDLGDADQGSWQQVDERLQITADGTSLFHGDDNGHFVYRNAVGDFRLELAITDVPVDAGGDLRKGGAMLRQSTAADAPRVMVNYIPHFPDPVGSALQFDVRGADGVAYELAAPVHGISLPVHVAIDKRDDLYTVYYSTDGGSSWTQPTIGGVGGQVEIDMGDSLLAGMVASSYDAETTVTVEFDDVSLCQPNLDPPYVPTPPPACQSSTPLDLLFLLDMSSSMSHRDAAGSQRFEIARQAIRALNDFLDVQDLGHRAALVTFSGFRTPAENLADGAVVHSSFTPDLSLIDGLLAGLEVDGSEASSARTTPTAIALHEALELLLADRDPTRRASLVLLSDGVPNIDRQGRGPDAYDLDAVAQISLRDALGQFAPWGEVAWRGDFQGTTATYAGETLANAMFAFEGLDAAVDDLTIYGIGFQGDGGGFGTAQEDLLAYGAEITGGAAYTADAGTLLSTIHAVLGQLHCSEPGTAVVGDRLWADLDGDGEQDTGEPEINGVRVDLVDDGGNVVASTTTTGDGNYLFVDVIPGSYTVRVDASTLPDGLQPTFDFDGTDSPHQAAVTLGEWEVQRLVDFGYQSDPNGGPRPPGLVCFEDDFSGNGLAGWATTFIGDADVGQRIENAGVLEMSSNGSALWGTDHHQFVYRSVNGDFRVETEIEDIPVDVGGTFRKAGLVVREGFDPQSRRIMAMFVPHYPNPERSVLQFGFRDADGGLGLELAETVYTELPVKLAIEKRGDLYTVFYSTNGGSSWVVPSGGDTGGGSLTLDMGEDLQVGLAVASYDAAGDFTASFDDFELCQPEATPPVNPPPVELCEANPVDIVYLVDRSSSMTVDFGGTARFSAAQQAILALNDALIAENDGSRAALVSFAGFSTVEQNLSQGAVLHSGLTADLNSVSSLAMSLDVGDIRPDATTPTALALRKTLDLLVGYGSSDRDPVVVLLSDGVPNIDGMGRGPDGYELDAVQAISLLDGMGGFLSWPQVAFAGGYNGDLGTYDGETLANAMAETDLLAATVANLRIFGVALQGNGIGLGTFNQDLLDYVAFTTGGQSFSTGNAGQLVDALLAVGDATNCLDTAEIGDRVWQDDNGDGNQDGDEPGINGVTVELLDALGLVVASRVTAGDGDYLFTGVPAGVWTVRVQRSTVPAVLDEQTFDFDGLATADAASVSVLANDSQLAVDFGYREAPEPTEPPPMSQVCFVDDFEDGQLDPTWLTTAVGDADQGSVLEAGGFLDLTSDGTSFYNTDHHHFLYQEVEGNFRVEVDIEAIPVDAGGIFRKGGLVVRNGFGTTGQRVMVQFVPHFPNPDRPVLQFGYRDTDGGAGQLLAEVVFATLPNRIALEKVDDTYTAFYSFNNGATWIMPTEGGAEGSVTFDMGDDLQVGLGVASYDGDVTMTTRFDDYEICQPLPVPPVEPPGPTVCEPEDAIDLIIVADRSGSMTALFPDGQTRFEAQQQAIDTLLTALAAENDGSRAAVITINGSDNVVANLTSGATLLSGLTTDLAGVNGIVQGLDVADIDPMATTTTPIALRRALELLVAQHDGLNKPVMLLATDGIPNIDGDGQGPNGYELEEIQGITLRDAMGQFLTWPEVAFRGNFNPELGTRDGETLARSMFEIQRLKDTFPELTIYGVALQGDGVGLGTFNEDLLEFAAFYSGGLSFSASDSADLTGALLTLLDDTNCVLGAELGDRVWADLDGDGVQDPLEPEINGVTVELFDGDGLALGSAVTADDGNYLFSGVSPGTYTVRLDATTLPSTLSPTFDFDGVATANEAQVTVGPGDSLLTVDFGYVAPDGGGLPSPPTGTCGEDDFDDGDLGSEWLTNHVGDADQGSFVEAGGVIQLTSDGSSLYNSDNHYFVYQLANGDFRAEVDVTDVPVDEGGTFRKVGLLARMTDDPLSPRVMAMFIPHFPNPDRPVLQFAFRDAQGGGGQDLSDVVFAELPVRLALQKQGDVYSVEYSLNGGDSWIQPTVGGTGGSVEIDMGDDLQVGLAAASYSTDVTFTAELDDFSLCQSGDLTPVTPPDPGVCDPLASLDVALVLDRSGSMTATFDPVSGENRFEASQSALRTLIDSLQVDDNNHRVALMSFAGFGDVQLNLNQAVTVHSGLTGDLSTVRNLVDDMDFTEINPDSTTPTALALHEVVALFQGYSRPGAQKVVVLITDGVPNIDIFGRGPIGYDLAEIQDVRLFDGMGGFLSANQVAYTGNYNPDLMTFDGAPLAHAMTEIQLIRDSVPEALIYGVALQGDGVGLGTFNEDLLQYAAYYTSAASYSAGDSPSLTQAMLDLLANVDCEDLP